MDALDDRSVREPAQSAQSQSGTARAAREANGDPRPSLEERYGNYADYVRRVVEAVNRLVAERLLLREDAEQISTRAKSAETAKLFAQ